MKQIYFEIKSVNDEERQFNTIITSGVKDRMNESINPDGWDFKNYFKNPVVLFAHKYNELPIGKTLKIEKEKDVIKANIKLIKGLELADKVWHLIKEGVLKAVSVGFIPKRYKEKDSDKYDIMEAELLEISVVPVPANPQALIQLGYKEDIYDKIMNLVELYKKSIKQEEKYVICGEKDLSTDDENSWDGGKAKDEIEKWADGDMEKYKKGFVIRDENKKENKTAYKLPFARVKDGKLVATWGGVSNAMKSVLGARSDLKVPETIKKDAYDFLADYYKKFDKEAPEYKEYTDEELNKLFEIKETKEVKIDNEFFNILKSAVKEAIKELELEKKEIKEVKENKEVKEIKEETKEKNKDETKSKILRQILFHIRQSDKNTNIALQKMKLLSEIKEILKVKNSK